MKIHDLKECPRCMGNDGFRRFTVAEQTELFHWGAIGPFTYKSRIIAPYQYHCSCCGVIIQDELKAIGGR